MLKTGADRFCLYIVVKIGSYLRCVGEFGYIMLLSVGLKTRVVMA